VTLTFTGNWITGIGGSVTLPSTPTPGNVLLAVGFNTPSAPTLGSGWTNIDTYTAAGALQGRSCLLPVQAGQSATITPFGTASTVIVVAEFKSDTGIPTSSGGLDVHNATHAATAIPPSVTSTALTPTAGALLFSVCIDNTTADTAPASVTGMTNIGTIPTSAAPVPGNGLVAYQAGMAASSFTKTYAWTGTTTSGALVFQVCIIGFASSVNMSLAQTIGMTLSMTGSVPNGVHLSQTIGLQAPKITLSTAANAAITQTYIEVAAKPAPGPAYVTQVMVEMAKSHQTVPVRVTQVMLESASPMVRGGGILPMGHAGGGGGTGAPIITQAPMQRLGAKYRILIYDTSNALVAIFTNVRAFDFIDSVNGGSGAGWFRISTAVTTLLAENTGLGSSNRKADQYSKGYLPGLNAVTASVAASGSPIVYTATFSGNYGPQVVTITIDNYYRCSVNVHGATDINSFTAYVANAVAQYVSTIKNTPYSVVYIAGTASFSINGASSAQFTPPGGSPTYIGVQVATSYTLPANLAAAYQQAFQYNYRVQFYLEDSLHPWYDGRINGWTPQIPDSNTDDSYITVYAEGWQNALDDGIVTETLSPGLQANGTMNPQETADAYLAHLLNTYQNDKTFRKPYIFCGGVNLFQMQFQGQGLGKCVNDVVTQVVSSTGHTFEWWVRGLKGVGTGPENSLGVVVQANADPKILSQGVLKTMRIAPTTYEIPRYFVYEVQGLTIYNYQTQNTITNLYNMIALYGGRDPTSQLQVYGAFEDAISISLYGVRQQRVTNDTLLNKQTLLNYATAYLLLNGYPQPQTQYYKYKPTDAMRAGVWVSVLEPGEGTIIAQTLHQMRAIQVECQLQEDQEKMDQLVTAAAPHPFIDHAYYGAIQQSKNTIPVVISRGGTINPETYMVGGGDWVNTRGARPPTTIISTPLGHFGHARQNPDGTPHGAKTGPLVVGMSAPQGSRDYPNLPINLVDTNSAKKGDGAYELDFCTDLNEFAPGQPHGQGILVTAITGPQSIGGSPPSGYVNQVPADRDMLRLWQFVVIDGAIAGAVDMRTYYGQYAGPPVGANGAESIMLTVPPGPNNMNNVHRLYQPYVKGAPHDWYGGIQFGITGGNPPSQVILWFCQKGAPMYNNNPKPTFSPNIFNGDTSWFGTISGTITQISTPDWATKYHWTPMAGNTTMMNKKRPITFVTQPVFEKLPPIKQGPLGSGSGPLRDQGNPHDVNNGGIFMNYDFPGGKGAKITIFMPSIELPVAPPGSMPYLYYEMELLVACTNGATLSTRRQFVIRNLGNGTVGG
jgi:hypothetical protein